MNERVDHSRLSTVEAWWALIARVVSFIAGLVILLTQIGQPQDRLYLIIAGIGLCGPVVAQSVATVFAAIRSGQGPGE